MKNIRYSGKIKGLCKYLKRLEETWNELRQL